MLQLFTAPVGGGGCLAGVHGPKCMAGAARPPLWHLSASAVFLALAAKLPLPRPAGQLRRPSRPGLNLAHRQSMGKGVASLLGLFVLSFLLSLSGCCLWFHLAVVLERASIFVSSSLTFVLTTKTVWFPWEMRCQSFIGSGVNGPKLLPQN